MSRAAGTAQGVLGLVNLIAQVALLFEHPTPTECSDAVSSMVPGGVKAQERVWTLRANGSVCSVREGESPQPEALPELALALCAKDGTVAVLTSNGVEPEDRWTLRRLESGAWRTDMTFDSHSDRFVALNCALDRVTLLTSKHVLVTSRDATTSISLSAEVPPELGAVDLAQDQAYLGLVTVGGKRTLLRVDLADGLVTSA